MSELAIKGCTIRINTAGVSAVSKEITTPPSSDNFVGNNGIYFGTISVTLTSLSQGNLQCPVGVITIDGTNDDVFNASNQKAVQKGDKGSAELTFTDSSSGTTIVLSVEIEVSDAGQTDVFT
jgi:hypothetical protein